MSLTTYFWVVFMMTGFWRRFPLVEILVFATML